MTDTPPGGPLHGVRVIELGGIGPVPFAGMMLADMGADVVRIDRPGGKDLSADLPPQFHLMNRGKRSVSIDLSDDRGRASAMDLIAAADVLLEGFRPGVAERLGLGPQDALDRTPTLVFGRQTGWGQDGPLATSAGHDITYIARSGALHAIGRAGDPPVVPLNLVGDFAGGGMLLVVGVLAALQERASSGRGQVVDSAMTDGAALMMTMFHGMLAAGQWQDQPGVNLIDGGAPFYDTYRTADDKFVAVGCLEERFYQTFCRVTGLDDLPDRADTGNWPVIRDRIERAIRGRTQAQWEQAFVGTDGCVAPVRSLTEAMDDEQLSAREVFVTVDGIRQPAPAPRFSRTRSRISGPPPVPGAHTSAVFEQWLASPASAEPADADAAPSKNSEREARRP